MNRKINIAIVSVFFSITSMGVFADHTVVNNLECVRDAGVITTSWLVVDSTEKYGGDLEVEAEFTARCSDELKPGKVNLKFHLSQDPTEVYSYRCDGSTNDISVCKGTAMEQNIESAVTAAIVPAAEALCKAVEQSLVGIIGRKTATEVRVKHLQKGEKVNTHCHDK
jgi:hypothetical protein